MESVRRSVVFLVPVILILCIPPCSAEVQIAGTPLLDLCIEAANRSWNLYQGRLAENPYNPGSFAWGLSHALRSFVRLYEFTGDRTWIDRSVTWMDHLVEYSDVNSDGKPAWGNYNETWGTDRYDYAEYTVHDGVICIPMVELIGRVYGYQELSSDGELRDKADGYLELVKEIIDYHAQFWTEVSESSGYYWRVTSGDDIVVINQFAALAIAEIMVADVTGDENYLFRPGKMARFVRDQLVYEPEDDCYIWDYSVGGRTEDVSHGSIDLELMILAHEHGLTFEKGDMLRLANTYQRRIWQGVEMYRSGIAIASHISGPMDGEDHTRDAKIWPSLSRYRPELFAQHLEAVEFLAGIRMPMDRVMARHLAELIEIERWLEGEGIDLEELSAFEPWMILPELEALNRTLGEAEEVGAEVSDQRALANQMYTELEEVVEGNVSELLGEIWNATHYAERSTAQAYVDLAESIVAQAKDEGIDTGRHELFLSRARQSLEEGLYESAINMCEYPLRLQEEVGETLGILALFLSAGAGLVCCKQCRD